MRQTFSACDLCYAALGGEVVDVQISPARLVQLTEEGRVAHRAAGLRSLRLCAACGDYLVSGFERLLAAHGRGRQEERPRGG